MNYVRVGSKVPATVWKTRVRDETIKSQNPYKWENMTSGSVFDNKRVLVFSLPGAFTPTCSTYQLPGYEDNADAFYSAGIDEIYVISVNDAFVMNRWAQTVVQEGLNNVKIIPDGNGDFTKAIKMDCEFNNRGFGMRSWRYAMVVDNGVITNWFEEPGKCRDSEADPYEVTSPEYVLNAITVDINK